MPYRIYLAGAIAPIATVTELVRGHLLLGLGFAFLWPAIWVTIAARRGAESTSLRWIENVGYTVGLLLIFSYEALWLQAYLQHKP